MLKPYYETENGKLYHGDYLEIMPMIEPVDLVLTDPPFFMPATHYQSRVGWQRTWGDTSILRVFWEQVTNSFVAKMKDTGHAFIFCNHESYPVFYPVMYSHFSYLKSIVWDKEHIGLGRIWRNQHELIITARWADSLFNNDEKLRADVLRHKATPSRKREHPVEKPASLLSNLIKPTTKEGFIVLDMFFGSGSTAIACERLNRRWIGIEIEKKYCEIAKQRITREIQQTKMF